MFYHFWNFVLHKKTKCWLLYIQFLIQHWIYNNNIIFFVFCHDRTKMHWSWSHLYTHPLFLTSILLIPINSLSIKLLCTRWISIWNYTNCTLFFFFLTPRNKITIIFIPILISLLLILLLFCCCLTKCQLVCI